MNGGVYSWRRYPCNSEHYHDGSVVDEVVVVPLIGLLTGDAAAWAGTNTVSTIGFIHLEGMRMVTVRPPTANISRARRRVVLLSVIETLPFARSPMSTWIGGHGVDPLRNNRPVHAQDTMFPTDERGLSVLSCRPLIPPRSRNIAGHGATAGRASREGDGVEGGTVRQGG
jgi:hypothetical protein